MKYEALLDEAYQQGLAVKEKPLQGHDGRIKGNKVAIRKSIGTSRRKACVLAEELGHYYTTVGDILDQNDPRNRKQERTARGWAYNRIVPFDHIRQAYTAGYKEPWEMADYLDVDEQFLRESMKYYEEKYGDELIKERQKAEFEEALRQAGIEFDE
ncbi:ImmA/IrrE family metallo-endopeptidase [Hominibacterium faecale]|uniref:ImmA/IrrE family metallo-endopeptidase n=1 Tax=Hominibacterium faecale TaxID=2839743 RepID=UPI0022B29536|nr:ImmA/IrrE family metallo-endopeptidase [Hominibacterium faecale]